MELHRLLAGAKVCFVFTVDSLVPQRNRTRGNSGFIPQVGLLNRLQQLKTEVAHRDADDETQRAEPSQTTARNATAFG